MSKDEKKTYKLSDFKNAGIDQFIRDLSSPVQDKWDENTQKENLAYFSPVKYLAPPSCPFPFDDALKNKRIYFPSIEEWNKCPDNKRIEMYHKAVDDFEAYRENYNEDVDGFKKHAEFALDNVHLYPEDTDEFLDAIEANLMFEEKGGLIKYEKGRSHFEFQTVNHPFHFDQDRSHNKWINEIGLRQVDNELVYNTIVDMDDELAIHIINKTVYDYIKTVTGDRELRDGDIFYKPMRELMRWAEVESIDFGAVPNVLEASEPQKPSNIQTLHHLHPESSRKPFGFTQEHGTAPRSWKIEHNISQYNSPIPEHLLRFSCTQGSPYLERGSFPWYTYEECGFHYYKAKEIPRRVQLLEQYALWNEMRKESPPQSVSLSWEEYVVIGNRHYTMKIQRDLNEHLKNLLNLDRDVFEKATEEVGGKKYTYYECLIKVTTVQEEKESHMRFTKDSQKKLRSGISDFLRDKKSGDDTGVYTSLDDADLI